MRHLAHALWIREGSSTQAMRLGALDVEDAVQETFLRAFGERARRSYDGLRPFAPWLHALGRATAIDLLRARGKVSRMAIALDPEVLQQRAEGPSPEDAALTTEANGLIAAFRATLDAAEAGLLTLRLLEDVAQESAAPQLGLTRSELRTRERRLREKLAAFLTERRAQAGAVLLTVALLLGAFALLLELLRG